MASRALYTSSLLHPIDATMASRVLTTIYSNLLSRMDVRSLHTFAPSDSNSESDIPTNNSDSDSRSKQLPHAEGKKNRAFDRFLKKGPAFPCKVDDDPLSVEEYRRSYYGNIDLPHSRYKMGEIVTKRNNIVFNIKPQMTMRNTCDSRRWFTNHTDAVSDATGVESTALSTNAAGDSINGGDPGILHPMVCTLHMKEGVFPNVNNRMEKDLCRFRCRFFKEKHNIMLENYGLYVKGNTDWHVARGSKLRYISIKDFIEWWCRVLDEHREMIYNYMFKHRIYVVECCPMTLLKHCIVTCFWYAPLIGWHKLNVSGVLKENLGGTKGGCGGIVRDCWGRILEIFHKPLPDATSSDEVYILGVHHAIDEILRRRPEIKIIILEIDRKKIFRVLEGHNRFPEEYMELYNKIFDMMPKFHQFEVWYQCHQGNAAANRVAYIASLLSVGDSFPIGDRGLITQVRCDQWELPRYEVVTTGRIEIGEDEEFDIRLIQ